MIDEYSPPHTEQIHNARCHEFCIYHPALPDRQIHLVGIRYSFHRVLHGGDIFILDSAQDSAGYDIVFAMSFRSSGSGAAIETSSLGVRFLQYVVHSRIIAGRKRMEYEKIFTDIR